MTSLKNWNWFEIDAYCHTRKEISESNELPLIMEFINKNGLQLLVLGEGSNVLLNENLKNYYTIKFKTCNVTFDETCVTCDAGMNMDDLIKLCLQNKLKGLEHFSAIPGNVGGCTFMNIHYMTHFLADYIETIYVFKISEMKFCELDCKSANFTYKNNLFKSTNDYIIHKVKFRLEKMSDGIPLETQNTIVNLRAARYPTSNTCGCFFYNLPLAGQEKSIGYQIEQLQLDTSTYENVTLYKTHKNMFITNNKCSCAEILDLATDISAKIYEKFGLKPDIECRLIGI